MSEQRTRPVDDVPSLVERLGASDRAALSQLLTLTACGRYDEAIGTALNRQRNLNPDRTNPVPVIAVTGSGGVGKSSLLGVIIAQLAARGQRIGVLACDPESPLTGGAILGDRCRIARPTDSSRVFIRSLSAEAGQQGMARRISQMLELMRAYRFDTILIETVGTGQSDTAVGAHADVVVLVVQPQTGDDLQWEKAGVLEIADVVVINKADLPGADQTVAEIRQQMQHDDVPVISTSATHGTGIDELLQAIQQVYDSPRKNAKRVKRFQYVADNQSQDANLSTSKRTQSDQVDPLLEQIADYVCSPHDFSEESWSTARLCLLDSLGCGLLALHYPDCTKLLGPVVPGATLRGGARVPGTDYELDPVSAAFNIGCMIRWLDFNDTWLAAEWGHPSDNFGGILATADWLARRGDRSLTIRDVLAAATKAYEIQGVLALENAFNRVGLDHVILVRIATVAVATHLLGGSREQIIDAVSNAWLDGGALRTYRHAPNTGSRKSWAAGDATRRGVQLALWTMAGEMGYASALSAPKWGFSDVVLGGRPLIVNRPLGCYVMENILFKVAFPAEFHAQTAAEAGIVLHPQVIGRLDEIDRIRIDTQESAIRIIDKSGPLMNPADRDHCLQYITAVALLHGNLKSDHYEDAYAADPRIDKLRACMEVVEQRRYSCDYLDPDKRSIANAVQVFFRDGSSTDRIEIEYPLGHRRRRAEALPLLREKFCTNAATRFGSERAHKLAKLWSDIDTLDDLTVNSLIDQFV